MPNLKINFLIKMGYFFKNNMLLVSQRIVLKFKPKFTSFNGLTTEIQINVKTEVAILKSMKPALKTFNKNI